jgi:hypothetical protein
MKGIHMNKVWIMAQSVALVLFSWSLIFAFASQQQAPFAGAEPKKEAAVSTGSEISLRFPLLSPR